MKTISVHISLTNLDFETRLFKQANSISEINKIDLVFYLEFILMIISQNIIFLIKKSVFISLKN